MSQTNNTSTPLKKMLESTFSPVTVRESPVSRTQKQGNLTGNPRKVRDSAADLYNTIQEWNKHHLIGTEILSKINKLKTSVMMEDGSINFTKCYPEGLQQCCEDLDKICVILEEISSKISISAAEVCAIVKLERLKNTCDIPMFLTWPALRFEETFTEIKAAYEEELALKIYIKENVAHVSTEANLMFYIASWAHQPFITSNIDVILESILKETGHR